MNENLKIMNEFDAVTQLVKKTQAEFVFSGLIVCSARELLENLHRNFDHVRQYVLDNGPRDNEPGVYKLSEDGEINPNRQYAPAEQASAALLSLGDYNGFRPSFTHFMFDQN